MIKSLEACGIFLFTIWFTWTVKIFWPCFDIELRVKMKRTNEKTSELSSGISVILNDNTESPHCPHGPTVLFQRHGSNRAFYACSAFRDRKECQFFVWRDDFDKAKWQIRPEIEGRNFKTYNELVANDSDDYIFCHTCNELMESTAVSIKSHKGHDLRKSI